MAFSAFPAESASEAAGRAFTAACMLAYWLLNAAIFAVTVCESWFQAAVTGPRSSLHPTMATRHRPATHEMFRFIVRAPSCLARSPRSTGCVRGDGRSREEGRPARRDNPIARPGGR